MLSGAILKKTKILSQHQGLRHMTILLSGKAGVYLIALLSQPVLARLYTPAQFGEFAFLNSILAILLVAACGRYEAGIILTKKTKHASRLFQLSQLVLIGYVLILGFLILFAPEPLKQFFVKQGLPPLYLWIIPLMVLFSGYWQIVQSWLIRFQKFSHISSALIFQRLIIFVIAVAAFYFPIIENGLLLSLFFGFLGIFIISILIKRQALHAPLKGLKSYAYHFRDFPIYSVPTLYLNLFMIHLPVLWITFFYSKENAGTFSLAYTLITVPVQLLHFSLGQIFYQKLAQIKKHLCYSLILEYCRLYSIILIPAVLIAFFYGKQFTQFILGPDWTETGEMVSTLALLMLIQGFNGIFMYALNVLRKQQFCLYLKAIHLILWIIAFLIGLYFQDIFLSIRLIILFSALHFIYTVKKVSGFIHYSHDPYSNCSLANRPVD